MNNWLKESRDQLLETMVDFLWQQWSSLGVAGLKKSNDNRIIDLEALLLFSLSICRYDPRLFDEIIDWLFQNGHLVNVQRLQQIQKKYNFNCGPQLSAIAELLAQQSKYKLKWNGLANKYFQEEVEPLFYASDGTVLPCPQKNLSEPVFLKHGIKRGLINLRGYSQSFDINNPTRLLLKLRSLLGINARAEILCLLASEPEIQPNEAARQLSYYQKTIQTTLVEMSLSGVISSRNNKKKKYYRLNPGILDNLLKPKSLSPIWVFWPELLIITEKIWQKISQLSQIDIDDLLLNSEVLKLLKTLENNYPNNIITKTYEAKNPNDKTLNSILLTLSKNLLTKLE
ncbi:MAG: helix-turn-helix transcriptional regulator [Phycisphaerae bacterium]|nr:helix-turn-helix transcriptional regulator [Phycisphaerae bacterium]